MHRKQHISYTYKLLNFPKDNISSTGCSQHLRTSVMFFSSNLPITAVFSKINCILIFNCAT